MMGYTIFRTSVTTSTTIQWWICSSKKTLLGSSIPQMSPRVAIRHCISTPVGNSLKVCLTATVHELIELELCFPTYAFQKVFSLRAVAFRQPLEFFEPLYFDQTKGVKSPKQEWPCPPKFA